MPEPGSVAETLRAARAKIEDPKHWVRGDFARTNKYSAASGTGATDLDATCWCAHGALQAVDGPYEAVAVVALADAIAGRSVPVGGARETIWRFNDHRRRKHAEVLAAFDKAIDLAETK